MPASRRGTCHPSLPAGAQVQLTAFAKQCLAEMAPKYVIEVFQEAELLVNITQHVLVPKHQVGKSKGSTRGRAECCCASQIRMQERYRAGPGKRRVTKGVDACVHRCCCLTRSALCWSATGSKTHSCHASNSMTQWRATMACPEARCCVHLNLPLLHLLMHAILHAGAHVLCTAGAGGSLSCN